MPLELRFLPASDGDAVWIRWGDDLQHQMLIDMGREEDGRLIRRQLEATPNRHFELLMVTHVDSDHIGGVLTCLAEADPLDGLVIDDVWFNGWAHLHGRTVPAPNVPSDFEAMGPAQGERLTAWLGKPWNEAFARGAVVRGDELPSRSFSDDLTLMVLGPTRQRLEELQPTWQSEVDKAINRGALSKVAAGWEAFGPKPTKPLLDTIDDLCSLADTAWDPDDSAANGASICVLLCWRGRRVLLTGDAWADDVVGGLRLLGEDLPIRLDVVKLPHHGSQRNVSTAFVRAVACPNWVVSTTGARHHHPDSVALARVVRYQEDTAPTLWFNVPSEFNGWWCDDEWKSRFNYDTEIGTADHGVTLTLQPVILEGAPS